MNISDLRGIDISSWQAGISASALNSVDFAILKIADGRTKDWCFDTFYSQAKIPVGAFVYSYATTEERAREEATKAIEFAQGRKLPLGIYIDIEEQSQLALRDSVLTSVVKAFCDTIRAAGYKPGAYGSGLNLWAKVGPTYLGPDVLVWEAAYGRSDPFHDCDIWQTSETGHITGYNGEVDTDVCMSERFIAMVKGSAPAPAPAPKDDYIKIKMPVVKYGDKGNAVKLMQTLLIMKGCSCGWTGADGDFGPKTEGALVMFKSKNGLAGETCDPQTWAALLEV